MSAVLSILKRKTLFVLLTCFLAGLSLTASAGASRHYAITLSSSLKPFTDADYPEKGLTGSYHVYITRIVINNRRWYRMNLGFFRSRSETLQMLKRMRRDRRFNDAWLRQVSINEYNRNTRKAPSNAEKPSPVSPISRKEKKRIKPEDQVRWNGSFSQFSSREILTYDDGTTENINVLLNSLGTEGHYQDESVAVRTNFDSTYRYTIYDDNSVANEWRLSSLHLAFNFKKTGTGLILGRQFANSGGVLGRFDGIWLSQRTSPRMRFNLYAGYPVDLYDILPIDETDRHFAGISLDMGRFADKWDFNLFGISQQISGIVGRQAFGGEIRYSNGKRSHLLLLDYDASYNKVNTFVLSSNWVLPARFTANLLFDSRTVPTLETGNALWGRPESGIDELLSVMSEEEIRQLALDRTTRADTVTVGLSRPVGNHYQLSMEFTSYHQTDMIASGGVGALYYGGRNNIAKFTFIGTSMFKQGDFSMIAVRHSDNDFSTTDSYKMNVRYPLTRAWRAGPTLLIERVDNKTAIDVMTVRPTMSIDYRWLSNITFDVSLSVLYTNQLDPAGSDSTDTLFRLGYRYDF